MSTDVLVLMMTREINSVREEILAYPQPQQMWLMPPGIRNSGGNLAIHIAGNLQHYIGAVLGETGYQRRRDYEFSAKGIEVNWIINELATAARVVAEVLPGLSSKALTTDYPIEVGGMTLATEVFLQHLLSHLAYHLGQINYHRRLVSGINGNTQPVSIRSISL